MFGTHDLWLFTLTVLVLNATPGVDMVFTLSHTLQGGLRAGLAALLGISAGCLLHTVAAACGLATLLAASATAFTVLKWVGALYLLWIALGMLRAALRPQPPSDAAAALAEQPVAAGPSQAPRLGRVFMQGLLTNALNPKIALFFLALLPQFIDPQSQAKTLAFLFLGAWMVVQGALFLLGFVLLAARLRRRAPRPGLKRWLQGAGGMLFAGLAAKLVASK